MTANAEPLPGNSADNGRGRSVWRTVYWTTALLILLTPLVAMQFTDEVNWTVSDFLFAGALFFTIGLAYEAAVKASDGPAFRWAVRCALGAGLLLVWLTGAVGIIGSEAEAINLLFYGVLAVGAAGTVISRFRPMGMARAMAATAMAQAAVAVGAIVAGAGTPASGAAEILLINGLFVTLWMASSMLFYRAATRRAG
jgi:hypothetical protein